MRGRLTATRTLDIGDEELMKYRSLGGAFNRK